MAHEDFVAEATTRPAPLSERWCHYTTDEDVFVIYDKENPLAWIEWHHPPIEL